jgi:hypothetical protein
LMELDGKLLPGTTKVPLANDNTTHTVHIVLG